jgi:glutamine---fructose-6-phosphate transaminase (isomerizing)
MKMCGIIAYMGPKNATVVALDGLKRLEYRGYDSWGIAWSDNGTIHLERKIGRIGEVKLKNLPKSPSHLAVAHTRWATHGGVEEKNAHPHLSNDRKFAVVHNGIIENFSELKASLQKNRFKFSSDTDSEVVPNLLQHNLSKAKNWGFKAAFEDTVAGLEGTYALVVLNNLDHSIAFARKGSPLCIGIGKEDASEMFVASDVSAFIAHTKDVIYLEEG